MGSQSKYNVKEWVYVDINMPAATDGGAPGEAVKYGFATNIPAGQRTVLGHTAITNLADPPDKLVVGCSFPKPSRANKRVSGVGGRFYSSYIGKSKITAAKNDGWRIAKSRAVPRLILSTNTFAFVKTVYVTVRGIKYAWNLPKVTETNAGAADITGLGIKNANAGDRDELCFGANFPKPPRASKLIPGNNTDGPKIISTFYDPSSASLPDNWSPSGAGILSL